MHIKEMRLVVYSNVYVGKTSTIAVEIKHIPSDSAIHIYKCVAHKILSYTLPSLKSLIMKTK